MVHVNTSWVTRNITSEVINFAQVLEILNVINPWLFEPFSAHELISMILGACNFVT